MTNLRPPMPEPKDKANALQKLWASFDSSISGFAAGAYRTLTITKIRTPNLPIEQVKRAFLVRDPEWIREILVKRYADFPKSKQTRKMLGWLAGGSMFTSNGDDWLYQRRIIDQAFTNAGVKAVLPLMLDAVDASLNRITGRGSATFDVTEETNLFAGDIIYRTLFSEEIARDDANRMFGAFEAYQRAAYQFGISWSLGVPEFLNPQAGMLKRNGKIIREELIKPIDRRLSAIEAGEETPQNDILGSLISCSDPETGKRFDRGELHDHISAFFLAGHETSAVSLGWSLYLLAKDQEMQDAVRREVLEALPEGRPAFSDVRKFQLARNTFREALRLYPPVAYINRDATKEEKMRKHELCPGDLASIPVWLMHRNEEIWEQPHEFCPHRFADHDQKEAISSAYLPFGLGARVCVGASFATQEAVLFLAMCLRQFRVEPVEGHTPDPMARLTIRSRNGIVLKFVPLDDKA
ncbi:cytochrome P450 [Parvularcula sp. ZS-1/3]|uniref:Cytochrome P450 n=1 Tax=Parvularcula mediterranea TaxID=2732508 RepID=A0A7Y3RM62_9PROT|nr:cytochrome P450 [Parvularcula mediterranea]NNU16651.1 cytochrome P450 [Parvularcula mediterranea]